jgi:hypothetical protein
MQIRETIRPRVVELEDRIMAPLSQCEREMFKDLVARVLKANEVTNAGRDS